MIVLDSSALVEILTWGAQGRDLEALVRGADLHAPDLIDLETASALRGIERGSELEGAEAEAALLNLLAFPVERHESRRLLAMAWKWRDNLTIYDSLYLELAIQADAALLTLDSGLRAVATERTQLEVLPLS